MLTTYNVIASSITIIMGIVAFYYWSRNKKIVFRTQNPSKVIPNYTLLSYLDFGKGIDILIKTAKTLKPDHIIGLNRGGAIVGACLAKKLGLPVEFKKSFFTLCVFNGDPNKPLDESKIKEQKCDEVEIKEGDTVLLVDDSLRTSKHMRDAEKYLLKKYPKIILKKYVLLNVDQGSVGPESNNIEVHLDKWAFITSGNKVYWPWDPDDKIKNMLEENKNVQKR